MSLWIRVWRGLLLLSMVDRGQRLCVGRVVRVLSVGVGLGRCGGISISGGKEGDQSHAAEPGSRVWHLATSGMQHVRPS